MVLCGARSAGMLAHLINGRYATPRADEPYTTRAERGWFARLLSRLARR